MCKFVGSHFNFIHLHSDQRLITTKPYLFTIGPTFNPSSMNNFELREFGLGFGNNDSESNSLDSWRPERVPAVQIQENEGMQVAHSCDTVAPAFAGSGHTSPDDALELQLFELE